MLKDQHVGVVAEDKLAVKTDPAKESACTGRRSALQQKVHDLLPVSIDVASDDLSRCRGDV